MIRRASVRALVRRGDLVKTLIGGEEYWVSVAQITVYIVEG